jgi:hypothetical protein
MDDFGEWFQSYLAFKYNSNWDYLCHAAASSYFAAGHALSMAVASWQTAGGTRSQGQAERALTLELHYKFFVSGPILAATLMPVFALESFTRMASEIGLRRHIHDPLALAVAVAGYDAQSFGDKIATMLDVVGAQKPPAELASRVEALVEFRNNTVHDTPLLLLDTGRFERLKRGKIVHFDDAAAHRGEFPVLSQSTMPLTLGHAKRAIQVHDSMVTHIFDCCHEEFRQSFRDFASPATHSRRRMIQDFGGELWGQCDRLNEFWENTILPWEKAIPLTERADCMRDMERRHTMKVVADE